MGIISKKFPCGCVVSMSTYGYEAGGDAIESCATCSKEKQEIHIADAYKESNVYSIPELEIDFGWGAFRKGEVHDSDHRHIIEEYKEIKKLRTQGKDWRTFSFC